jgi:hypothetical protein
MQTGSDDCTRRAAEYSRLRETPSPPPSEGDWYSRWRRFTCQPGDKYRNLDCALGHLAISIWVVPGHAESLSPVLGAPSGANCFVNDAIPDSQCLAPLNFESLRKPKCMDELRCVSQYSSREGEHSVRD